MYRIFITLAFAFFSYAISHSQVMRVKPYLQDVTATSAKFMLESDITTVATVHYGLTPFSMPSNASGTNQVGNGLTRIHTISISGLTPNTKYYYRVSLANNVQSSVYNFTTLMLTSSEQDINFVAVSDMQMQTNRPTIFSNLINLGILPISNSEIQGGIDNLHGMLIPGDLVQTGGNYDEWKNTFFDKAESLSPFVPIYPVPGNHEYYNDGLPNFVKYFDLPANGNPSFPDEWWYKDFSNIRVIGLNSNTPTATLNLQLSWLQTVVDQVCSDTNIDFVFVQLHHPFKSELWTPGELGFTGQVIQILENFTQACDKPSIHFFGHTHGYSRGQSKNHQHLWVNVATAGGAIDYWGAHPQQDYDEFTRSDDDYGFVLVQTTAGLDPSISLKRYSRGDDTAPENNVVKDQIELKKYEFAPKKPTPIFPFGIVSANCVTLKASAFNDPFDFHQGTQWQVSTEPNFTSGIVRDIWKQHQNFYNEVDTQLGDNLTDQPIIGLNSNTTYHWRARYRDSHLKWSEWSSPLAFITNNDFVSANLLLNSGAESGITSWTGQIESLLSDECNSVPVYVGDKFFAVGGVCTNEQSLGLAEQSISVASYATLIDQNKMSLSYGGYLRAFSNNNDNPEMYVSFYTASNTLISTTSPFGNSSGTWTLVQDIVLIPATTRNIKIFLRGTRNTGTDNDSYFDELFGKVIQNANCPQCIGRSGVDLDSDGYCSDIDCDDNNAAKYPGAIEVCDGIDNDCDGLADLGNQVTWTGLGDGTSWVDGRNWDQYLPPIACQHVILSLPASIILSQNVMVSGITISASASLHVSSTAGIIIDHTSTPTLRPLTVNGTLLNQGKIEVKICALDAIHVSGTFTNQGKLYLDNTPQNTIMVQSNGTFDNQGLVKAK